MLRIEYSPVSDLRPDPRNARKHPKKQIDQIAQSITEFGFVNPILIDERNSLIAGHGRLLAAKRLRLATVPTIRISGLSDVQKRALRLADNKIAQAAAWDPDLLQSELKAISLDASFNIELTGFAGPEIDRALRRTVGKVEEVPPLRDLVPVGVKPGDIWRLGQHRIACGDCRDPLIRERLMGGGLADMAFLDPPYNVPISGFAVGRGRHSDFGEAVGELTPDEFQVFLRDTLGAAASMTRSGGVHFVAMDWRHLAELHLAAKGVYGQLLNICVWNKTNAGMGSLYRSKHELISVYRVGTDAHFNAVELGRHGRNRTNVWDYSSVNTFNKARRDDLGLHPTVKPTQMVADAIMDVTKPGQVVLDAFLGSGTSLLAAEQTGRVFRGVEIDPRYVETAIGRWAHLTCQTPMLEGKDWTLEQAQLDQVPEAI